MSVFLKSGGCGFVTTAHGLNKGDEIYLHEYDSKQRKWLNGYLGKVKDLQMGGSMDAAVVEMDNSSIYEPSGSVKNNLWIGANMPPYVGKSIDIVGASNGVVPARISKRDVDIYWNNKSMNDTRWYKIWFNYHLH